MFTQINFEGDQQGESPMVKKCPPGKEYNQRKQVLTGFDTLIVCLDLIFQKCTKVGDVSDALPLDQKALGRNFVLGSFYDGNL